MKNFLFFIFYLLFFTGCISQNTFIESDREVVLSNVDIETDSEEEYSMSKVVDSVIFRHVQSESYDEVEIFVEELNRARSFELSGISLDDQHYLNIESFVEFCNKINTGIGIIKRMQPEQLNKDTGILNIIYYKGKNYTEGPMRILLNSGVVDVESVKVNGDDLNISLDVSKHAIINDEGTVFLPVYLFNYYIYTNATALYRYEQDSYKIIGDDWEIATSFLKDHSPYYPTTDYKTTHSITEDYLRNVFGYTGQSSLPENLTEIEAVYDQIGKFISLEDSHFRMLNMDEEYNTLPEEFVEKMKAEHLDFLQLVVNGEGTLREEEPKWICDTHFYFPIASFFPEITQDDRNSYLTNTWNMFVDNNEGSKKTIILDVRDNGGGYISLVYSFVEMLIQGNFSVHQSSSVHGQHLSDISYNFNNNPKTAPFDLILLINDNSFSASIVLAGILKDNTDVTVYGTEPLYKDASHITLNVLPNGTILSRSAGNYLMVNEEGIPLSRSAGNYLMVNEEGIPCNDERFVDISMTDQEIDTWLESIIAQ